MSANNTGHYLVRTTDSLCRVILTDGSLQASPDKLQDSLNELYEQGWEFVNWTGILAVFRRRGHEHAQ